MIGKFCCSPNYSQKFNVREKLGEGQKFEIQGRPENSEIVQQKFS